MLAIRTTSQFEKDVRRVLRRGLDLRRLRAVMDDLIQEKTLPSKLKDHKLTGELKEHRECHIAPDWLLIYMIDRHEGLIVFVRTGSHSDLFR